MEHVEHEVHMAKRQKIENLVSARLDRPDLPKVEAIMSAQERSRSYVIAKLVKAGLAACPAPGQLPANGRKK